MLEAIKPLIDSGIVNEDTKQAIAEAWEAKLFKFVLETYFPPRCIFLVPRCFLPPKNEPKKSLDPDPTLLDSDVPVFKASLYINCCL